MTLQVETQIKRAAREAAERKRLLALLPPNKLEDRLVTKQDVLVSGASIKTVNGESLLGPGDVVISGGGSDVILGWAF